MTMETRICKDPAALGESAAVLTAQAINACIAEIFFYQKKSSFRLGKCVSAAHFAENAVIERLHSH